MCDNRNRATGLPINAPSKYDASDVDSAATTPKIFFSYVRFPVSLSPVTFFPSVVIFSDVAG